MFVPLHVYSSYTFLSSGFTIDRLISTCKNAAFHSVGLTDKNVLFGFPEFVQLSQKYGLHPLLGMDVVIDDFLCSIYAKDEQGYRWLVEASSTLQQQKPLASCAGLGTHGIVVVSPQLSPAFQDEDGNVARRLAKVTQSVSEVYLGIPLPTQEPPTHIQRYRAFASQYTYAPVAFPHILYPKPSDAIVLEILGAIHRGETLTVKEKHGVYAMPSSEDLRAHYSEQELANTTIIASQCKVNFYEKRGEILHVSGTISSHDQLREKAIEGLQSRPVDLNNLTYLERLNEELEIIENLGYSDYFLLVADFIHFAKSEKIPVGPGRGSAPGSLVAYALGITDIDPIEHDLLFERFLNPSRKTMPDIDVDIADTERERVVDYLRKKYGADRVANIITFQTIQAKQAVRDIGRVYGYSQTSIELISKVLSEQKEDLRGAYRHHKPFQDLFDSDAECAEIIKLAHKIEGFVRQSGMHPAGVILNEHPLQASLPVLHNGQHLVSQYDMNALESQGFLKIDILGLRNLSHLQTMVNALKLEGVQLDLASISLHDDAVYETLRKGLTVGVFQLESAGMNRAIQLIQPTSFQDLASLLALYRPGPMDNIASFAKRKKGLEPITSLDPQLNPILAPTYGIIVYQEQIMQIAQKMAGFPLSKADDFRRAISKKDSAKMQELKSGFLRGAVSQGYKEDHALSVFNHIVKFADYGFNKSHSVAYAVIAYQMLYIKTHYPHAFFAAMLNQASGSSDEKLSVYLEEMRHFNISIKAPSLAHPSSRFRIQNHALVAPLTLIKGLTRDLVKAIEKEFNRAPFVDFFDFVTRLYGHKLTAQMCLNLIDAGAMDGFHPSRATLRATIPNAMKNASVASTFLDESLGLLPPEDFPKMPYVTADDTALENIERELAVLEHFSTQSVVQRFQPPKDFPPLISIATLIHENGSLLATGGIIKQRRIIQTKTGQTMAFMTLYDETGSLECIIFPRLFETVSALLERGKIVAISGKKDAEKPNTLLVDQLKELQP